MNGKRWVSLGVLAWFFACPSWAGNKLTLEAIFAGEPLEGSLPRVFLLADGLALIRREGESQILVKENWQGSQHMVLREGELSVPGEEATHLKLSEPLFSPDGRWLVLSQGGDLFLVDLASKACRRLTRSPEPEENVAFSPDGLKLAYVRAADLFLLELASGKETRLTQDGSDTRLNGQLDWVYTEELYNRQSRAFAFSPDSQALLYLSFDLTPVPAFPLVDLATTHPRVSWLRYPKAGDANARVTVTVTTLGTTEQRIISWSFTGKEREYVARFGWLPSSQAVWLLFLDRSQRRAQLLTFPLASSGGELRLEEQDEAWLNIEDDWLWTSTGSLVFGSERSGFRHLYRVDPGARKPVPLTTGTWEVTEVLGLSQDERFVYFVATEASPLQRHLYRVPVAGGQLERLTHEPGTHSLRAAPGCRAFLDSYSTASQLPQLRLLTAEGKLARTLPYDKPPKLQDFALGSVEFLTLVGPGGETLYASLLKPPGFDPSRRYPVVVYVYGGPHAQVVRDAWGGRTALFHHFLAQEGFLVFSLDNRGSTARGRAFERAISQRLGKVELEDQLAGVVWLSQQPFVDSQHIGIWGWSYGGYMTLYALTHSQAFAAGAAVAPVTDWRLYDTIYTERYLKLPEENPEGYKDSSPIHAVTTLQAPLLLAHGTGDDNVHWQNTLNFIGELIKAQKPYTLHLYPNKNHGIPGKDERLHLFTAIYRHFRTHLLEKAKPF